MSAILHDGRFETATPESMGISSEDILDLLGDIREDGIDLHSIYIFKNGKLVTKGISKPFTENSLHRLQSAGKSVVCTAVLFAIQEGLCKLDDPVIKYFPEYLPETYDSKFNDLTIYNLLTMCTGHDKDVHRQMMKTDNWVKAFFSTTLKYQPGTHWFYNNAVPHILSCLIKQVSGEFLPEYLEPRLTKPMGLRFAFEYTAYGEIEPATILMSPESFAKYTLLYLQEGEWNGVQLIDRELMRMAGSCQVPNINSTNPDADSHAGYGWQLWRNATGGYRISGGGGQYGMIFPDAELAVAVMSFSDSYRYMPLHIANRIYHKLHGRALPENPRQLRTLQYEMDNLTCAPYHSAVTAEFSKKVSGREYVLPENELNIEKVRFDFATDKTEINVVQNGREYKALCGMGGNWIENREELFFGHDYTEFSVILNESKEFTLLSGGWTSDGEFEIRVRSYASMVDGVIQCDFRLGGISMTLIPGAMRGRCPIPGKFVEYRPIHIDALE